MLFWDVCSRSILSDADIATQTTMDKLEGRTSTTPNSFYKLDVEEVKETIAKATMQFAHAIPSLNLVFWNVLRRDDLYWRAQIIDRPGKNCRIRIDMSSFHRLDDYFLAWSFVR